MNFLANLFAYIAFKLRQRRGQISVRPIYFGQGSTAVGETVLDGFPALGLEVGSGSGVVGEPVLGHPGFVRDGTTMLVFTTRKGRDNLIRCLQELPFPKDFE